MQKKNLCFILDKLLVTLAGPFLLLATSSTVSIRLLGLILRLIRLLLFIFLLEIGLYITHGLIFRSI